jgi:hypothetical protein
VVGAALAILEAPEERARFVEAALPPLRRYLSGSTISDEGLSWEGIGYWDYGFGNYLLLAEALWQNSGGKINLYAGEPAARTATAVRGLELSHGTYPAFSDCPLYARPNTAILWLIKERFGRKGPGWPEAPDGVQGEMRPGWAFADEPGRPDPRALAGSLFGLHPLGDRLAAYGIFAFPVPPGVANATASDPDKLRSFFPKTGLAVLRDFTPGRPVLSLAVKGHHNGEPHGHHDQGSYVVAVDGWPLLTDPGSELYTPATFNGHRFESMMNNSLGHPVPVVAGSPQRGGVQARTAMTFRREGEERDVIEMDLTACYDVPELKKLTRTFTFLRKERRSEIVDAVEFSAPRAFGSAFVTNSPWKENDPARFKVSDGGGEAGVYALIESRDGTLVFKTEPVTAPRQRAGISPVRIGYTLREPVTHAAITTVITVDEAAR